MYHMVREQKLQSMRPLDPVTNESHVREDPAVDPEIFETSIQIPRGHEVRLPNEQVREPATAVRTQWYCSTINRGCEDAIEVEVDLCIR